MGSGTTGLKGSLDSCMKPHGVSCGHGDRFKSQNFCDLTIELSALYLISAPSTPEPVQREVIERAKRGEPMTRAKALEVLEDYKSRVELPPPSLARQIAIANGQATAASNDTYILPMSKEDEEALISEQTKIRTLYDAIKHIAQTDVTPQEMVILGRKHACRQLKDFSEAAVNWLNSLLKELHARRERTSNAG
jgi:hypothetical protein